MPCPERGAFVDRHDFRPGALPTVMRKAFDLARDELVHAHRPVEMTQRDPACVLTPTPWHRPLARHVQVPQAHAP
jgi:hypothetical protein